MEMLQEDVYDNSTSTSYDGDTSEYTDTEGSVSSFNDVEYVQPNNVNPISSSTPGWVEETTSMNPDDYRPVPAAMPLFLLKSLVSDLVWNTRTPCACPFFTSYCGLQR